MENKEMNEWMNISIDVSEEHIAFSLMVEECENIG